MDGGIASESWTPSRKLLGIENLRDLIAKCHHPSLVKHMKMTGNKLNRTISIFYVSLALLPIFWMILVLTNYLLTAQEIGLLPLPGVKIGQERFPIPYSGYLNIILMMTTIWGIVLIPALVCTHFVLGKLINPIPMLNWKYGAISYLGCGLYLVLWNFKPFADMMTWYIDWKKPCFFLFLFIL